MVESAAATTSVSSATMKEATAASTRTQLRCVMAELDGAARGELTDEFRYTAPSNRS